MASTILQDGIDPSGTSVGDAMRPAIALQHEGAFDAAALAVHSRRLEQLLDVAAVIEEVHGLSPVQEAMLFHAVGSAADDLYIVQQRLQIDGPLDVPPFQQAWNLVVARHRALRSVFAWDHGGSPVQIVCRGVEIPVTLVDLATREDAEEVIEAAFAADRAERYDLTTPPLMRITLFRVTLDRHVMLWSQHHRTSCA